MSNKNIKEINDNIKLRRSERRLVPGPESLRTASGPKMIKQ